MPHECNRIVPQEATRTLPDPADSGSGPMQLETSFRLGHRQWLDGLRGIAVLFVLAYHLRLVTGGCFGVDVFFVLSGFLITTLLVEEWRLCRAIDLKRFYARRALRLLPAFLVMLGVGWLYNILFGSPDEMDAYRKEMTVAACYVSNWPDLHQTAQPTLGHTWSLSVEEQFYLLWPLLLCGMLRLRLAPRTMALWLCAGVLASAVLRRVLFDFDRPDGVEFIQFAYRLYVGLHTRADALLTGCLVGVLAGWDLLPRSARFRRQLQIASVPAVAVLAFMFLRRDWLRADCFHGLFTLFAAAVAVLLVQLLTSPSWWALRILESRPLVGVGRISYALYLYHIPIMRWLRAERLGWDAPVPTLTVVALSLGAALASYFVVERPCLRWKSRLRPAIVTQSLEAAPARELSAAA